ncbi:uncharacterized protein LOC133527918 isoform X2 [Cydia pomonella]|uniref:uncharacterized protein LOC133527918 isoform X2 n=1 Tax=Cydia pomonella TaxID=82600 RepID=UPI002ADE1F26|nr:uncharacterized protein LOC133527918 isoform X2 [Cydia pomonella]
MHSKERNRFGSGNTMFLLCNYITVPMLTMLAGQKAHNEADQVVRTLARLQNILLRVRGDGVAELNKTVINLHRLMTVKRIRIEILSDVVLHMPMLPDIIHTVISYTIHFLQFNHIV